MLSLLTKAKKSVWVIGALVVVVGYFTVKDYIMQGRIDNLRLELSTTESERDAYQQAIEVAERANAIDQEIAAKTIQKVETIRESHRETMEDLNNRAIAVEDGDGTMFDVFNVMYNGMRSAYCDSVQGNEDCT